jgi:3-oxoacyl-[acyl-carrier-protein] synthase II
MGNRVVITGIAPVTSMGIGKNEFFNNLMLKKVCIDKIPEGYCKGYASETQWYVPYPKIDFDAYGEKIAQLTGRAPLNAIVTAVSATLALADAGIEQLDEDSAVVYGVGVSNMPEFTVGFDVIEMNKRMHPHTIPYIMTNAVSAWISILFEVHGMSHIVSTACASGTSAIGEAFESIRAGRVNMAICGGADCITDDHGFILRGFDLLGALTKTDDGFPYPFSEERTGFLFSEGAACSLVLEEYERAKKRGATIYAEITDYRANCDAHHIVQMPPEPVQIKRMLRDLAMGEKVDFYSAHGTATPLNDATEGAILSEIFGVGPSAPLVNSTKGFIGHSIGAAGAIEAAVCVYAIKNSIVHGNIMKTPMSGLNLPVEAVKADINCAISSSFGFGGHNAALKFRKVL